MKKILMTLAAAGLMLTGCTKNETSGYSVPDTDVIGFSSSTSRATVNDLSTLTGDAAGFRVYGTADNLNGTWYPNVNGENNYACNNSNWGWVGDNAEWPDSDQAYPMNFYAMYPADAPTTADAGGTLSREVTIAATAATQKDLLAAKASTMSKPASGKLTLTFDHILSKINFGVIAGHNMQPEVLSVRINNVHSHNTYNYIGHVWGNESETLADYVYFDNTATPYPFTTIGEENEERADSIYKSTTTPVAAAAHLMLMPQSPDTGAPSAWSLASDGLATEAYIEVLYRITDVTDPALPDDYIGYTEGYDYMTAYPNYANPGWGTYLDGLGNGNTATEYNGPLYIKAGFPVSVKWEPGRGYTYNICLGTADSTNGYYISTNYFDNAGSETTVPIIGPDKTTPVVPGEPVTNGIINFLIDVSNWVEAPASSLQ